MSFSCTQGAHFQGFRPPKSIQKSMKKRSKNGTLFWSAFGRFGEPFCDHFGVNIASKNRSKKSMRFWINFWTILAPSWGPCGVPFALRDATGTPPTRPRRSQDAPKMLPRRSRMPIRHPKRPQEGPTHLQARFWTILHRIFIDFSSICFH